MGIVAERPAFYFDRLKKNEGSAFQPVENYLLDDSGSWTEEMYQKLDDEQCFEIIEGSLYMSPAPSTSHQECSREIGFSIYSFLKANKLGQMFSAPFDVYLSTKNIVQPDLVVIGNTKLPLLQEKGLMGAPDIAIEILLPGTKMKDLVAKRGLYQKFLVPEYWIVDPGNKSIEVYVLDENNAYRLYEMATGSGVVKSWFLKGYELELKDVFIQE